jgi:putative molybdopterin biosynthesis protein
MQQEQFLRVIDRDEAERRFRAVLDLNPLSAEVISLSQALHRVLAQDVVAPVDVPGFDRSNVDGFAVQAQDTFGATEDHPITLMLNPEVLAAGVLPVAAVAPATATTIATGGVVPRGADAVVMVEHTDLRRSRIEGKSSVDDARSSMLDPRSSIFVFRPVAPGANITFAGTDIGRGETVLRRGDLLTSRETGVLAALGITDILVVRRPRVAILSTGNELVPPGALLRPGLVYDSNSVILADAVRELGGEPVPSGIVSDDPEALRQALEAALACDAVLLSGGTSKGEGDLSYRVVAELGEPGIVAHGVALKPGKPLCLAAVRRGQRVVPVAVLPGFPTSAIFTFHEFLAPILRQLAGRPQDPPATVRARLPMRVNSERGRTEYLLVGLVAGTEDRGSDLVAYPMGKGSGSVTTFSRADGFVIIPRQQEYLEADSSVEVHLLDRQLRPADLVVIGSHCVGLDFLLGLLQERGFRSKMLAVGSTAGLQAAGRGECDLAGIHLLDEATNEYNRPFVGKGLTLLPGYRRLQGIVYRPGDSRFAEQSVEQGMHQVLADPDCVMVNRNRGSGTRILIDQLLGPARPPGYFVEARSHNAVAAAVAQRRADWGVAIRNVAEPLELGFLPLQAEHFDFVIPTARLSRPAVSAFQQLLREPAVQAALEERGFGVR